MHIEELLMHDQFNDENLAFLRALGVDFVSTYLHDRAAVGRVFDPGKVGSVAEYFAQAKARAAGHGLKFNSFVASAWDEFILGGAQRDERIEEWLNIIRGLGRAGIPVLGYNFRLGGAVYRTAPTPGRGGAAYSTFNHAEYLRQPLAAGGAVSNEQMWENLVYFLGKVVPVAEAAGVRMALHPDDPPVPGHYSPLAGIAHVLSSIGQFKRAFAAVPSDCNGMLFCQGCVTEMQDTNVYEAIGQLGAMNKIVLVHFRAVRGSFPNFRETFIDEGDVDMLRAMQTYRDTGFNGPFILDHSPDLAQSGRNWAGRAFAIGYMRALIQVVYGAKGKSS
jgi:mannonate dehydratase